MTSLLLHDEGLVLARGTRHLLCGARRTVSDPGRKIVHHARLRRGAGEMDARRSLTMVGAVLVPD